MEEKVREEALKKQQDKSELEQTAARGVQGGLELKKEEKRKFLGEFKERVLIALTRAQVEEAGTYPQVMEGIKDPEAEKIVIDREVDMNSAREYIRLAQEYNISFKKVGSPEFEGEIGLVVVSDQAVDREEIFVKSREEYLRDKGIPNDLITAQGEKLCADCYQLIAQKAPEELDNYKQLSWFDKLLGKKCPGSH